MDNTMTIANLRARMARNLAALNGARPLSAWERTFRLGALARDTAALAEELAEAERLSA